MIGFILTASLWVTYFLRHAERGAEAISRSMVDSARAVGQVRDFGSYTALSDVFAGASIDCRS